MESVTPTHPHRSHASSHKHEGSRIPGFYKLSLDERLRELMRRAGLGPDDVRILGEGCLAVAQADHMVENVVGTYALPLGLGLNFQINGRDYLVPMCVEEPSVVAAASNAARMVRDGGGFHAEADPPHMIAQGRGVVLSLSTPASRLVGPGFLGHAVACAGVEAFSRHLAGELGASGVRTVCIRSHAIPETLPLGSHAGATFTTEAQRQGVTVDQMLAGAATGTVLRRLPTLDDLAATVVFLASDGAAAITGAVVNMSGLVLD